MAGGTHEWTWEWVWGPVMYEMTGPHVMPGVVHDPKTASFARRRTTSSDAAEAAPASAARFGRSRSPGPKAWRSVTTTDPPAPVIHRDVHNRLISWAEPPLRPGDRADVLPPVEPPGRPEDRLADPTCHPLRTPLGSPGFPGLPALRGLPLRPVIRGAMDDFYCPRNPRTRATGKEVHDLFGRPQEGVSYPQKRLRRPPLRPQVDHRSVDGGTSVLAALSGRSERGGEPGALVDRALGVQLGGDVGAADDGGGHAGRPQLLQQVTA